MYGRLALELLFICSAFSSSTYTGIAQASGTICPGTGIAFPDVGWSWAEASAGMNISEIQRGLVEIHDSSLAIFATRCGAVFFTQGNVTDPTPVYSIGKTVVTTWVGVMLAEGNLDVYPHGLDTLLPLSNDPPRAGQFFHVNREWGFPLGRVGGPLRSLRHFLSMTSAFGLYNNSDQLVTTAAYSHNAIEFLFRHVQWLLPLLSKEQLEGNSILTDLQRVEELFHLYLNGHEDSLELIRGQISGYGSGLNMSARDATRLGLLYLSENGVFDGRRVLSEAFSSNATVPQVPSRAVVSSDFWYDARWNIPDLGAALPFDAAGHNENARMRGSVGYGFGLWILPNGAFYLSGKMGNYVFVDRDLGLVISIVNNKEDHPNAIDYLEVFRRAIIKTSANKRDK
jgi:CubicO group peptidase (beta-lactamase class C family)